MNLLNYIKYKELFKILSDILLSLSLTVSKSVAVYSYQSKR